MKPDILDGLGLRCEGAFENKERADRESIKGLTESGKLSCGCYTSQARAPGDGFHL